MDAAAPTDTAHAPTRSLSGVLFLAINLVALATGGAQLLIEASAENSLSVLMVLVATLSTMLYLQFSRAFDDAPISSLAVLGLCVTTQTTSLVSQTFARNALVEGLKMPLETFAMLTLVQALALLTHWIYRRFRPLRAARSLLTAAVAEPLGLLRPPSPAAVWTLALIGAASLAVGAAETGQTAGKVFQALGVFAWLPAVIPILYARHGRAYCSMATHGAPLVLYVLLLVGIGMARNGRSLMVIGPVQLGLILLMYGLRDHRHASRRMIAALAIGAVLGAGLISGARDVATAMVVVRDQKDTLAPLEMLQETLLALGDRGKLEIYRGDERAAARFEAYDEIYLDNPLLARFSETKFHDNMLSILERFGPEEREAVAEMTWIKMLTVLPQPVLNVLGVGIDKDRYEFSMGDYYRSLTEREDFLGGAATGSIWADLLAIFDWWAPLVAMLMFVPIYLMLDMLSRVDPDGRLQLSPLAVCSAWAFFLYGLGAESLVAKVAFVMRDFPQRMLLYALAAGLLALFLPWKPRTVGTPIPGAPGADGTAPFSWSPASKGQQRS